MQKKYSFDYTKYKPELIAILEEIDALEQLTWKKFRRILSRYPKDGDKIFSKNNLVVGLKGLVESGEFLPQNLEALKAKVQMKPVRTQSGVTTVTVLTKPFPCPGKCIFCPNDVKMPKSYLSDEPGAQRAERNKFDPYLQTYRRLEALKNIGHNTSKIELIILGGTWSYYPEPYQIWFIKRCFEALNDFGDGINHVEETEAAAKALEFEGSDLEAEKARTETYNRVVSDVARKQNQKLIKREEMASWEELFEQHKRNESNNCRNVGLVIETRPDNISEKEVIRVRKLGCTKTQIGFQSLDDEVLKANKRGHDVDATKRAVELLRKAGFKIHAHWMANLYGSTLEKDIADYKKMFESGEFNPDELKIYPCSLIESAELYDYYKRGVWKPYNYQEMHELLTQTISLTPNYTRLTRVVREFSADDIVDGNKLTNFRQIAENSLDKQKVERNDIRSREIKTQNVELSDLELKITTYQTPVSEEKFLEFVTKSGNEKVEANRIAGFLRLSLPKTKTGEFGGKHDFLEELDHSAIIREIHVYGKAVNVGKKASGKAQHLGLGTKLIAESKKISKEFGFQNLAVISAIGTREYYRKKGFEDGELYQSMRVL